MRSLRVRMTSNYNRHLVIRSEQIVANAIRWQGRRTMAPDYNVGVCVEV